METAIELWPHHNLRETKLKVVVLLSRVERDKTAWGDIDNSQLINNRY
jgi:hypothetical protein